MLTGRNEWLAIGALILYIAFVPCPYPMKQFFESSIGKVVALGAVIYAWKFVSCPVAILLLVAFLRSGAMREYLDEATGVAPSSAAPAAETNFSCPSEFVYDSAKKMCSKGTESKSPECADASMAWDTSTGKCVAKPTSGAATAAGGPPGGTSPGSMAAMNEMANSVSTPPPTTTESFIPYSGKVKQEFASL